MGTVGTGHRMSALPVVQYCGKAGVLGRRYGAGRAAAMSRAFHAKLAGESDAERLWRALDTDEREEVAEWHAPATISIDENGETIVLDYASAEKELEVALSATGGPPSEKRPPLTVGHLDFAWTRIVGGRKLAYVADVKKTSWTTLDGPESLQLHAYGSAYAQLRECDGYVLGIWIATDGRWLWGTQVYWLDSAEWLSVLDDVVAAASHTTEEACTGQHCRDCWSRMHCEEHVLPVTEKNAEHWLAPLATPEALTNDKALQMLLFIQSFEEVISKAKKELQVRVERGELRIADPLTNKVYKRITMSGRESVSVKTLREKLGAQAERLITRGGEYSQFRWINDESRKRRKSEKT